MSADTETNISELLSPLAGDLGDWAKIIAQRSVAFAGIGNMSTSDQLAQIALKTSQTTKEARVKVAKVLEKNT